METLERYEKFAEPLGFIKDSSVRNFAKRSIELLPDYFFEVGASSSGKYHPEYAKGEGGLLRHTLSAVRAGVDFCKLKLWEINGFDRDLIIAAIIPHDGWKLGVNHDKYTVFEHPNIAVEELSKDEKLMSFLDKDSTNKIFLCIKSHMGQWNVDTKRNGSKVILDIPNDYSQPKAIVRMRTVVHLADYMASRPEFLMDFSIPVSLTAS